MLWTTVNYSSYAKKLWIQHLTKAISLLPQAPLTNSVVNDLQQLPFIESFISKHLPSKVPSRLLTFLFCKAWPSSDRESQTHLTTKWPGLIRRQLALLEREFCFAKKKTMCTSSCRQSTQWVESNVVRWGRSTQRPVRTEPLLSQQYHCVSFAPTCSSSLTPWYFYKLFEETWNAILTFASREGLFTVDMPIASSRLVTVSILHYPKEQTAAVDTWHDPAMIIGHNQKNIYIFSFHFNFKSWFKEPNFSSARGVVLK